MKEKKQQLMRVLVTDRTKHQIQTGLIMKTGAKQVFEGVLAEVRKALEMLNQEIGDQP